MITGIALKKPIGNPKILGRVLLREGDLGASAQIVTFLTQVYVLVHGVIDRDIYLRTAWLILQMTACGLDFQKRKR